MAGRVFREWWGRFCETGDICPLRLGATRAEVRALFGEPDQVGVPRRGVPLIFKYDALELHFEPGADGALHLIYQDESGGVVRVCIARRAP